MLQSLEYHFLRFWQIVLAIALIGAIAGSLTGCEPQDQDGAIAAGLIDMSQRLGEVQHAEK